jgi:hypothetical protein
MEDAETAIPTLLANGKNAQKVGKPLVLQCFSHFGEHAICRGGVEMRKLLVL